MTSMQSRTLMVEPDAGEQVIDEDELRFQQLKVAIHEKLVDSLDLSLLAHVAQANWKRKSGRSPRKSSAKKPPNCPPKIKNRLLDELFHEVFGLGPLEPLMQNDHISDILVNHPHEVFIEQFGRLEKSDVIFADDAHLMRIIQRVVSRVGRRIDEVSPMVDARLPDGSRVNAVIPPLALDGPTLVHSAVRQTAAASGRLDRQQFHPSPTSWSFSPPPWKPA